MFMFLFWYANIETIYKHVSWGKLRFLDCCVVVLRESIREE